MRDHYLSWEGGVRPWAKFVVWHWNFGNHLVLMSNDISSISVRILVQYGSSAHPVDHLFWGLKEMIEKTRPYTPGWAKLPYWTKILMLMEKIPLDIKTKWFAKFQLHTTNFAHGRTTPLSGKVVVPHFWIVHLVSLITPKQIEPITWDWSHFGK